MTHPVDILADAYHWTDEERHETRAICDAATRCAQCGDRAILCEPCATEYDPQAVVAMGTGE